MFKQSSNQALIQKVSLYCIYIECEDRWISTVVLTKNYAVTTLHCIPNTFQQIGLSVILCDAHGQQHNAHIHGLNKISDYVVFKKADGVFDSTPEMVYPMLLDQYIVVVSK